MYNVTLQETVKILNNLLSYGPFAPIVRYCSGETPGKMIQAYKSKVSGGKKYKFGVQVPFGTHQAVKLDAENDIEE